MMSNSLFKERTLEIIVPRGRLFHKDLRPPQPDPLFIQPEAVDHTRTGKK